MYVQLKVNTGNYIIQLKFIIERVSMIPVPQEQAYFPGRSRGKKACSRDTGILLPPAMVYFNCYIIRVVKNYPPCRQGG